MSLSPLCTRPTAVASLLLTVLAGCGGTSDAPSDLGQQSMYPSCAGPATRYRITQLHVPTEAEATSGLPVGRNVDGIGEVCGVPDFPGDVDNALIELSSQLTTFIPSDDGVDLQAIIDTALSCPVDADPSECRRLDLILIVSTGPGCASVEIKDGEGTSLAGPMVGLRDPSGRFRGTAGEFRLTIPYPTASGLVDVTLDIADFIMTADIDETAVTDIILSGAIVGAAFEERLMELLPLLGDDPSFEDVQPILASLYDVRYSDQCSALSVGFTGSATLVEAP